MSASVSKTGDGFLSRLFVRVRARRAPVNLSPSRPRKVDVGDRAARTPAATVPSWVAAGDAARQTCAVHGVPAGHCFDDLGVDGFCGGGEPERAWLTVSFGDRAKPGLLRAEGWRAVELGDWMERVGAQPIGPWAVLGLRALPPADWDAAEVVADCDVEIVHHPSEREGARA